VTGEKTNKKISIPLSFEDLEELQQGKEFNWTFEGIEVYLFQGEEE